MNLEQRIYKKLIFDKLEEESGIFFFWEGRRINKIERFRLTRNFIVINLEEKQFDKLTSYHEKEQYMDKLRFTDKFIKILEDYEYSR